MALGTVGCAILSLAFAFVYPKLTQFVIDDVIGRQRTDLLTPVMLGLLGAFGATRLLKSLLFGVDAWDPITFIAIVFLISVVAFLAAWLPARRATLVDPIQALRTE